MSHLGNLGKVRPEHAETFGYFGETIRVNPDLSELEILDFAEKANTVKEDSPEAVMMVKTFFRSAIHGEDFERFWKVSKSNRQSIEDLLDTVNGIIGKVAGRPTGQPSGSSTGRRKTKRRSRGRSSDRALILLEGRPDLQEAVVMRREGRPAV
jgi:hypothetical protein